MNNTTKEQPRDMYAKLTYMHLETISTPFGVKDKYGREVGIEVTIHEISQDITNDRINGYFYQVAFDGASIFYTTIVQHTRDGKNYQKASQTRFEQLSAAKNHATNIIKASFKRALNKF